MNDPLWATTESAWRRWRQRPRPKECSSSSTVDRTSLWHEWTIKLPNLQGSFRVKSPKITENLNPTVSDFTETWYTCCLGTHSTKSKILGQSDQWCGRYGPPNFESFDKNRRGCQPLNPHISGTSDPIFIKLVLMDRQFDKNSKYVILVQIGECLGALTFRPLLWPWHWPCGSRDF